MIDYRVGNDLDIDQITELYRASTLGVRRPVDDPARMRAMFSRANLVVTAWEQDKVVGVARSLSDFAYCTYLSDLAVHVDYQRRGIGKELMRRTQELSSPATLYLFAAPAAVGYYPHVGFNAGNGFILPHGQRIKD